MNLIHQRQISETDFRHRDKRGGHLKQTLAARKTYARRSISITTDRRSRKTRRYHRHHTLQAAETDVRGGRNRHQRRQRQTSNAESREAKCLWQTPGT